MGCFDSWHKTELVGVSDVGRHGAWPQETDLVYSSRAKEMREKLYMYSDAGQLLLLLPRVPWCRG